MYREHVQAQVFGVPVFVDNGYLFPAVRFRWNRLGITDSMNIHTFHLSGPEIFLFDIRARR